MSACTRECVWKGQVLIVHHFLATSPVHKNEKESHWMDWDQVKDSTVHITGITVTFNTVIITPFSFEQFPVSTKCTVF